MSVDELRAHILGRIAELEAIEARVRAAPQGSLGTRNDIVDRASEGRRRGELAAYRDVLARLPGTMNGQRLPTTVNTPAPE